MGTGEAASRQRTAPHHGRVTTWLMSVCLIVWAVWLALVLATPVHEGRTSDILRALENHESVQWVAVQAASDSGAQVHFSPGLADPLRQEWDTALLSLSHDSSSDATPGLVTAGNGPQIAWRDADGVHVTREFSTSGWSFDASGLPTANSSPSAAAYRALRTSPQSDEVASIRDLTYFPDMHTGTRGGTTYYGSGIVMLVSLVAALSALFARQPRFRTRWSWFWIFGCPFGIGLVWFLLREGWFGRSPAPEPAARPSGWNGLIVFALASFVVGGLGHAWLFR